jgi:F420-dependent oxidoreductase-like protein
MLEAYTTLGHVAALTERMTLGVLVTGVMYRHPGLLAKTVTTLDVLSGGRARLGIGASWYEREQRGLGVPVVPVAERFERLEETLQICLQMWSDNTGPYTGRHHQLAETMCFPMPISQPHPPILVGGGGEKKTLRLVARYADACNVFGSGPAEVANKLEVLRSHCEAAGRDYDRIQKTVLAVRPVLADVDGFLAAAREYAALGVTELQVMPDRHPVEFATEVAERVLPNLD